MTPRSQKSDRYRQCLWHENSGIKIGSKQKILSDPVFVMGAFHYTASIRVAISVRIAKMKRNAQRCTSGNCKVFSTIFQLSNLYDVRIRDVCVLLCIMVVEAIQFQVNYCRIFCVIFFDLYIQFSSTRFFYYLILRDSTNKSRIAIRHFQSIEKTKNIGTYEFNHEFSEILQFW